MDFWNVARISLVRWYVTVPILAAAIWFGVMTGNQVPPQYLATSSVLIVGPSVALDRQTGEMFEQNPYLTLGGAIGPMTPVLRNALDAEPRRVELAEEGIDGYEILTEAPMLHFEVTGEDPDAVLSIAKELLVIADQELVDLQGYDASFPIEQRVSAQPVVDPISVVEDDGGKMVVLGVAAAAGLLLAVTAALITDALVTVRRRRQHLKAQSAAERAAAPSRAAEAADGTTVAPAAADRATVDAAEPADRSTTGSAEPVGPAPAGAAEPDEPGGAPEADAEQRRSPGAPAPENPPSPDNPGTRTEGVKELDEVGTRKASSST